MSNFDTHGYKSVKGRNISNQEMKSLGQQPSEIFSNVQEIDQQDIRLTGQLKNNSETKRMLGNIAPVLALIIIVQIIVLVNLNLELSKSQQEMLDMNGRNKQTIFQLQRLVIGQRKFGFPQHRPSTIKFSYPTVGVPIPGNLFNSTKVEIQDLLQYGKAVRELFKPYNDTDCEYVRYGNREQDGGYVVCNNFIAKSQALVNIGVSELKNDLFGCQLTSNFKIPNYQYECNDVEVPPVCHTNNDGNVFLQACVSDQKEKIYGSISYTLKDIINNRLLNKKHITLKIDTHGGEYSALKYFPMEDLDYIDQIVIDLHFGPNQYLEYWGHLDIFRSLAEKFIPVNFHQNNWYCYKYPWLVQRYGLRAEIYEVTLINKRLIKLNSNSRSYVHHPTNKNSDSGLEECQPLQ